MISRNGEPNMKDYQETYSLYQIPLNASFNFGFDVVDKWADTQPNFLAMLWTSEFEEIRQFSFQDLKEQSNQIANLLRSYGLERGDKVMTILSRLPEWWLAMLAFCKLGIIAIPGTTQLTLKDVLYRVERAEIKAILTEKAHQNLIDEAQAQNDTLAIKLTVDEASNDWIPLKTFKQFSPELRREELQPVRVNDPLLLFFTSGTTGNPKMVLHPHSYPLGHVATAKFWYDLRPSDVHWTISDTGWAKCAWGRFFGPWHTGAGIFVYHYTDRFIASDILRQLETHKITSFCGPPTVYRMLIREDLTKYNFSALRHCTSAGEPLNPEVIATWERATGLKIYEGYGQTETTLLIGTFRCMQHIPGAMGWPCPGYDVQLVDDYENLVGEPRKEGHIVLNVAKGRPIGLFEQYWKSPDANVTVFRNGWYYTGDKAYKDEKGYFYFVGRSDDVIKSSGYRIGPFEIESILIEHPAVFESAVVGSPDPVRGMVVKAFIVLNKDFKPSDELVKDIQNFVKRRTAPYKYPREIEFVSDLPKTISGKIRRIELRALERMKKLENS